MRAWNENEGSKRVKCWLSDLGWKSLLCPFLEYVHQSRFAEPSAQATRSSPMSVLNRLHSLMPASDCGRERRREDAKLCGLMAVYALVYLAFFPPMYTSLDEAASFGMAYVLRHGTVFPAQAGYDLPMSPLGPHGPFYRFPIGYPAVLALASFAGQWALFLVNPVFHLIATWLFAKVLRVAAIPSGYAALYLLYPGFVLYDRTLFSDPFAASLVTISLYCFLRPRGVVWAGACLGLALTARSTGIVITGVFAATLLLSEWYAHKGGSWKEEIWKGRMPLFLLGLLPFLSINAVYNFYTTGSALHSTYRGDMLTLANLVHLGPLYAASLLLIFPGMILAPFFYRSRFWRAGLVSTSAVLLIAGSYYETTYGNNPWETLISVSRQILPVMPLYLLAYCGVLSKALEPRAWVQQPRWKAVILTRCLTLLLLALVGVSAFHQRHLKVLVALRSEILHTVPADSIIYANKDVFKLRQPLWERAPCRELTHISDAQAAQDLKAAPVYVVLYLRKRGIAHEDGWNGQILAGLRQRFVVSPGPASSSGLLQYSLVKGLKASANLPRQEKRFAPPPARPTLGARQ